MTLPGFNNWLLFSATVEAALAGSARRGIACASTTRCASTSSGTRATARTATGPTFHFDYYNSFVIQPMLLDVLDACGDENPAWKDAGAA